MSIEIYISETDPDLKKCDTFAIECSSPHRNYRSGGKTRRNMDQIRQDMFRGKVGEIAVKKHLEPIGLRDIELDFNNYGKGGWDNGDIQINDKIISVKSTAHYSRYLMIE